VKRFKNILFLADRDEGLQDALQRAVIIAQTNQARLTVMDVTPDAGLADYLRRMALLRPAPVAWAQCGRRPQARGVRATRAAASIRAL
jgi:nucleotide-binding universal stress UspA family protein